jgi:hypothetical protein
MIRLKNWVTMDTRKLRTNRFLYEQPDTTAAQTALIAGSPVVGSPVVGSPVVDLPLQPSSSDPSCLS